MKNLKDKKIGILGLTHLGCVLAACWSKLGLKTLGVDLNTPTIENLKKHIPPIYEPGLEVEISQGAEKNLLEFSNDIKSLSSCDFLFFGFDTEVDDHDSPDTSYLEERIHEIGPILKENCTVIISSQVPAGWCRTFRAILKNYRSTLELVYSPENLQLGQAIQCYLNPGRIILGIGSDEALHPTLELFHLITQNIAVMSLESAELVKHGINAFLATSIVFSNQLADVCEKYPEASILDVVNGIKSDIRIGSKAYLSPGIGFSGGTLGRDVAILGTILRSQELEMNFFDFIYKKNQNRKETVIKKAKDILKTLKDKTIGVLGITYKPGTSTLRRSLPLEMVQILINEGAKVQVFDPKADYSSLKKPILFTQSKSVEEAAKNADLLLLLTEWPEFKEVEWSRLKTSMKNPFIFDAKNALNKKKLIDSGFRYVGIGG